MKRWKIARLSHGRQWLAALALTSAGSVSAQVFYSEISYPVSQYPSAIATGDLDGDGFPDAVTISTPSFSGGMVSVLRNDGTGLFLPPSILAASAFYTDGVLGDVTGDGRLDLVLSTWTPPRLEVMAGDGAGGFGAPALYPIPISGLAFLSVRAVALGDVNGDGWLDAITVNKPSGTDPHTSLFLADGAGGFLAPVEVTPGLTNDDSDVVLADFNGDTALDLLTAGRVIFGDGAGHFTASVSLGLPLGFGYAAGDLNGDGALDIAQVDNLKSGSVRIVLGNGAGGFGAPVAFSTGQQFPNAVRLADLDGDGKLDVVTANKPDSPAGGKIVVLHGDGAGGLGTSLTLASGTGVSMTDDVVVADFDQDGRPDLLSCNNSVHTASLYRQSDGSFTLAAAVSHASLSALSAVALADLDGDGDLDAAASREPVALNDTALVRSLGNGSGALGSPVPYTIGAPQQDIALGDLNGDGRPDTVAVMALLDRVAVLLNDGAGGLLPVTLYPTGDQPVSLALGDVNADGRLDAITANAQSHDISVLLGDGAGALAAPMHHFVGGLQPDAIAVDDLDDNGTLDLVTTNWITQDLSVLLGDGTGGFTVLPTLPGGGFPQAVAIGDLDGDGHADLVAASASSMSGSATCTLSIFRGEGAGAFAPPLLLTGAGSCTDLAIGDLNGDGRPDVVALHKDGNVGLAAIRLGNGNGTMSLPFNVTLSSPSDVALGDINGDQRLDLVVSQSWSNPLALSVMLNASTPHVWRDLGHALAGSFGTPELVGIGSLLAGSPGSLTLGDAYPNHLGMLFVAPTSAPASFKGGVLVPVPPIFTQLVRTGSDGRLALTWDSWMPGAPGSSWYFQYAIVDRAAPANVAFSNALRALQP